MAQLKSGTRIYGTATIDTSVVVGSAVTLSSSGINVNNTNTSQLNVSGVSTLGGVKISSGIVTASSGIITYFGDGSKLTGLIGGVSISPNTTNQTQYLTYVTGTGSTDAFGVTTASLVFNPSSGTLGIGTTSPGRNLHVQGDVRITGAIYAGAANSSGNNTQVLQSTGTGIQWVNTPTPSAAGSPGQIQFNSSGVLGGAPYFYYDTSKVSIGIGTTLPTGRLSIANTSTGASLLLVNDNTSDGSLFRVNDNNGFPLFDIDAGGSVVFNTYGNVGIGSTIITPTSKLQVDGNMSVSGVLTATTYGPITSLSSISASTTLRAGLGTFLSATSIGLGIGTANPTAKLQVVGASNTSLLLVNENLSDGCLFRVSDLSGGVLFDVDANSSIVAPICNNFGIGVFTPTAVLHLRGGTATASTAPLKFTSGSNLTTPEVGAVEYDGTVATLTPNTSLGRAVIATPIFTSGASPSTLTTGLTNIPLFPATNDTITLPIGTYLVETAFQVTVATSTVSANVAINMSGGGNASGTVGWFATSAIAGGGAATFFTPGSFSIATNSILTPVSAVAGRIYQISAKGIMKITSAGTLVPSVQWSSTLTGGTFTWDPTNFMVITPLATSPSTTFTGAFS